MKAFSLSNIFLPISHEKFLTMVTEFRGAVEQSFGQEVALDIVALSRPKLFQLWAEDGAPDWMNERNRESEILRTPDLSALTHKLWQKTGYVEIDMRPVQASEHPQYAHIEAKGNSPDVINFLIRGGQDEDAVARHVFAQHQWMLKGDGETPSRAHLSYPLCIAH